MDLLSGVYNSDSSASENETKREHETNSSSEKTVLNVRDEKSSSKNKESIIRELKLAQSKKFTINKLNENKPKITELVRYSNDESDNDDDNNDDSDENSSTYESGSETHSSDNEPTAKKNLKKQTVKELPRILPSASEIFAKTNSLETPSYLKSNVLEFSVPTFSKKRKEFEESPHSVPTPASLPPVPLNIPAPKKMDMPSKFEKTRENKRSNIKGPNAKQSENMDDKTTAKDRVKRQRLRGQSGIGSDFKVWRTDEEMVLRQQFD